MKFGTKRCNAYLYDMERCLICNSLMKGRKGKVVCSTTCRVNKKKCWDEYDKLYDHFVKRNIGRDTFYTDTQWKRGIVQEIINLEKSNGMGNVVMAWRKKKHPRYQQIEIENFK